MLVRLYSAAVNGLDVKTVEVEVNISKGAKYSIVGLPDSAVRESYFRTRTAILNSGFQQSTGHIIVNLAPADLRKEGSGYDLPIAVGVLAAEGAVDKQRNVRQRRRLKNKFQNSRSASSFRFGAPIPNF